MSTIIDIVIGLAFVLALVSLICSGLQEWLSAALNLRGKTLWEGVQSMLQANAPKPTKTTKPPKDGKHVEPATPPIDPGFHLANHMGQHPLIKGQIPDSFGVLELVRWLAGYRRPSADVGDAKPSYLEAATFATVLADTVGELWKGGRHRYEDFGMAVATMPDGPLKTLLQRMVDEADGDPVRLRSAIEAWFDETMVRVGGWYKRRTQVLLAVIGLVVACAMNIDAIHIATSLATQPALRESLADRAVEAARTEREARQANNEAASGASQSSMVDHGAASKQEAEAAKAELRTLNLPIGWDGGRPVQGILDGLLMVLGWLLTALAASFGAPFWFDLIGRLAPLRSTGSKPSATTETSSSPASPKEAASPASARPSPANGKGVATPFRGALNDYESHGISDEELLRVKKILGSKGANAQKPLIDQGLRDAIKKQQATDGWPDTGELSSHWVQGLLSRRI